MKNIILRSISGIIFVAVMVLGCTTHIFTFTCLQCIVIMLSMMEFYRLMWGDDKHMVQKITGVATGLMLTAVVAGHIPCIVLMLPLPVMLITQLYMKDEMPFNIVAQNILGILYIALPVSLWYLFVHKDSGDFDGRELLGCFIILWSCDVGAYVFGRLFGRKGKHKLFPRLSPKKTWEGLIGGFACAMAAAYVVHLYLFPGNYNCPHCIALAVITTAFGVWGDLVESQLKRCFQVKDSGNLIPGHGGLLDRFDASFLTVPAVCFYLKVMGVI